MARRNHVNQFNPKMLVPDYKEDFDANKRSIEELSIRILELRSKYPGMTFSYSPPGKIVGYDLSKLGEVGRQIEERKQGELGIDFVR